MSKIKDTIEEEKEFARTEPIKDEPKDYHFDEAKHIHLFKDKPLCGTSTVMGVVAKPLTWWASGLAVAKLGWINSKIRVNGKYTTIDLKTRLEAVLPQLEAIKGMSGEEFLALLDDAYKAHSVKLADTAEAGTDMHAVLENYVKTCIKENKGEPMYAHEVNDKLDIFVLWATKNVKKFLYSEMYCYSEKLWVGGISDLAVELNDGKVGIMDFKSSKDAYPTQFFQCAGYALQIAENGGFDKDGNKIFTLEKPIGFYAVVPFGAEKVEPVFDFDVKGCEEGFISALTLYKQLQRYENNN
jgi:hypothetical protein